MLRSIFRAICEIIFAPFVVVSCLLGLVYMLSLLAATLLAAVSFIVLLLPISPLLVLYLLNNQNIIDEEDDAIDISNELQPNEEEII